MIQIKKAVLKNLTRLLAIENECFSESRISEISFCYLLTKANADVLIILKNNIVCGDGIILYRKNSASARLYSLAISKKYQGQGLSKKLLCALETSAQKKKYRQLILEVRKDNISAIKLYETLQYKSFGEIPNYYEDGMTAVRMKKIFVAC